MKSAQFIVWGVILIVIGLAVAGWGGFRSYNDINTWVSARSQIKELEGMTPEKIAEMKKEANASQNPLDMLAGAFLLSPEFVEIAKAKAAGEMSEANQNLYVDLPLALVGLALLLTGNRMLGRAKKAE